MKQTAVEWLDRWFRDNPEATHEEGNKALEQAKAMEKEQIKNSFVECWKANIPDGVECKLDAEQYYNETFKSE